MPKLRIQALLTQELYDWMEEQIKNGTYGSRSHIVREAMKKLKEETGKK